MLLTERERLARGHESECPCGGTLRHIDDSRLACRECDRTIVTREHTVRSFECLRCSHQWKPRVSGVPKKCPRCGSYDWNKPYVYKKHGKPAPSRERKSKGWVSKEETPQGTP